VEEQPEVIPGHEREATRALPARSNKDSNG
jgi:hypothetical protein